ncbi:sulfatase family protein, partial [Vibrio harveyi]
SSSSVVKLLLIYAMR